MVNLNLNSSKSIKSRWFQLKSTLRSASESPSESTSKYTKKSRVIPCQKSKSTSNCIKIHTKIHTQIHIKICFKIYIKIWRKTSTRNESPLAENCNLSSSFSLLIKEIMNLYNIFQITAEMDKIDVWCIIFVPAQLIISYISDVQHC